MTVIKFDRDKANTIIRDLSNISNRIERAMGRINNTANGKKISLYDTRLKIYGYRDKGIEVVNEAGETVIEYVKERYLKTDYTANARSYNSYIDKLLDKSNSGKTNSTMQIQKVISALDKIKDLISDFESDSSLTMANNLGDMGEFDFNFLGTYGPMPGSKGYSSSLGALVVDEAYTSRYLGQLGERPSMLNIAKLAVFDGIFDVALDVSLSNEDKINNIKGLIADSFPEINPDELDAKAQAAFESMLNITTATDLKIDDSLKIDYMLDNELDVIIPGISSDITIARGDNIRFDVNNDGKIDINDVIAGGRGYRDDFVTLTDINGDGKIDGRDLRELENKEFNVDTDGDGKPDLNIDTDGDGKPKFGVEGMVDVFSPDEDDKHSKFGIGNITIPGTENEGADDGIKPTVEKPEDTKDKLGGPGEHDGQDGRGHGGSGGQVGPGKPGGQGGHGGPEGPGSSGGSGGQGDSGGSGGRGNPGGSGGHGNSGKSGDRGGSGGSGSSGGSGGQGDSGGSGGRGDSGNNSGGNHGEDNPKTGSQGDVSSNSDLGSNSSENGNTKNYNSENITIEDELVTTDFGSTTKLNNDTVGSQDSTSTVELGDKPGVKTAGVVAGAATIGAFSNMGSSNAGVVNAPTVNGMAAGDILGVNQTITMTSQGVVPNVGPTTGGGTTSTPTTSHGVESTSDAGTVKGSGNSTNSQNNSTNKNSNNSGTSNRGGSTLEDRDDKKDENSFGKPNKPAEGEDDNQTGMLGDASVAEANLKDEREIKVATGVTAVGAFGSAIAAVAGILPIAMFILLLLAIIALYTTYRVKKKHSKKKREEALVLKQAAISTEEKGTITDVQNINDTPKEEVVETKVIEETKVDTVQVANKNDEFSDQPYEPSRDGIVEPGSTSIQQVTAENETKSE